MRRSVCWILATCAVCTTCIAPIPALASSAAVAAEPTPDAADGELAFDLYAERPVELPEEPWTPRVEALPGPETEMEKAAARLSLPSFTNSVTAKGQRYTFTELGPDPSRSGAPRTTLRVLVAPIRAIFDDGTIFDPTLPDECAELGVPATLVQQSPIFQNANYGDGARQYVEQFRRFEFWHYTGASGGLNPSYSVRMSPTFLPTSIIRFHDYPTQVARCGRLGLVDINTWDAFVRGTVIPTLRALGVSPADLVLFLFDDVVFYNHNQSTCCTLGYHSWFSSQGVQTYGVAEFDSSRDFAGIQDVEVLAHELAEWTDDPLGNNPTPKWGHVGQVKGCQANLEVGDPLTGHSIAVKMSNGVTYHPQELAFFSWFFDEVPSLGVNGWYSMNGTFRSPAAACR